MALQTISSYINPKNHTSIQSQLTLMLTSFCIISYLLYNATISSNSADPIPQIYPFTPQAAKKIGISPKTIVVETGLYIENFYEFDMINNNFALSGTVWFKFDPAVVSLETIGKFSFDGGDILSISKPDTKLIEGLLFAEYRIKLKFHTNLNYRNFPVDDHRIHLRLTNKFITPKEIIFSASESGFSLAPTMIIANWKERSREVATGYTQELLDRHDNQTIIYTPIVLFTIEFTPEGMRRGFVLFLPLFLIFCLAVSTLSLDPKEFFTLCITLSIGNVSALIAYRFVIENMAPKVGYFLLSDYIFNGILLLVVSIFFFQVAYIKTPSPTLRGWALLVFHGLLLAMIIYLLVYWAK